MTCTIPFNKPFIIGRELHYISKSIHRGKISGNGFYAVKCQSFLQSMTKSPKVLMTPSCTAGLEMAMLLIGLRPGDEVIMPSFTFVSTANAVVLHGGVPVFCEIRKDNLNIDETCIEALVTSKTRAIIPVHYAGVACNMSVIMEIAEKHGLYVIEDAAQGLGSYFGDHHLGTIGDIGVFSFHETKNAICGEGGAILINNAEFHERADIVQEKGTNRRQFFSGEVDKYTWVDIGSSFLPSELQMAFLFAQLERIQEINGKRKSLVDYYRKGLSPLDGNEIILPPQNLENQTNNHLLYFLCQSKNIRDQLIQHLKENSILAVFHYIPLHSSPAGVKWCRTPFSLPITDGASERIIRLPLFFELNSSEQDRVIESVFSFFHSTS